MNQSAHIGSSFEDFLREQHMHEQVSAIALGRVLAWVALNEESGSPDPAAPPQESE